MPDFQNPKRHVDAQSRRRFLRDSSLMVAGGLSLSRAAHASGDERIRIGLIGCGRQGTRVAKQILQAEELVHLHAMADIFRDRLQASYRGLKSRCGDQVRVPREQQFVGLDGFASLVETDVDLVILASPPCFQPSHLDAAVLAEKHIYAEPPLAVDVVGVQQVLAANEIARRLGLCVEVGFQKRHDHRYQETAQKIASGFLGEILGGELLWVSGLTKPSPRHRGESELEFRLRNWRHHEGLGGHPLLEKQIHSLDVVNWILGEQPIAAKPIRDPNRIPGASAACHVEFTYPSGIVISTHAGTRLSSGSQIIESLCGELGTAQLDAGIIRDRDGKTVWRCRGKNTDPATQMSDLLAAIRQGTACNSVDAAAASTLVALMGRNVALGQLP